MGLRQCIFITPLLISGKSNYSLLAADQFTNLSTEQAHWGAQLANERCS